jgi:putative ABC transport system substrate-binding protein
MMDRRAFVAAAACSAAVAGRARAAVRARVVFVAVASRSNHVQDLHALREGLAAAGRPLGPSLELVELYADGDLKAAEGLVAEALRHTVDVFLAAGPAAARLILRQTSSVPIVAIGLHPDGGQTDLFATLAKPGGVVTGLSNFGEELAAKRVELLREAVPGLSFVAVVHNVTEPVFRRWGEETETTIIKQGLASMRLGLSSTSHEELRGQLTMARSRGVQALVIVRDFLTSTLAPEIVRQANALGIVTTAEIRDVPDADGLMSYGANIPDLFRRSGSYIVKIVGGARPAELPIELPTKFELVVNLRTAKTLGLIIPPSVLIRADEVIE